MRAFDADFEDLAMAFPSVFRSLSGRLPTANRFPVCALG
jgi:hypothetical protein